LNELDKPILRTLTAYKDAVFTRDVDAFIALYDQDVRVFDMWGTWEYNGADAWRGVISQWFATLGTERVAVDTDDVQIIVAQDVAILHTFVAYKAMSAEGGELRSMHNRMTWGLRQKSGFWKIVHEHTSAPVDFATAKVILQR